MPPIPLGPSRGICGRLGDSTILLAAPSIVGQPMGPAWRPIFEFPPFAEDPSVRHRFLPALLFVVLGTLPLAAQEKSVKPGINKSFRNPDVKQFIERFEREGREIWDQREQTVRELEIKPGMAVADVGAGTGFMTMLFAKAVGKEGTVYAVDIAKNFLKHIEEQAQSQGLTNIKTVLASDTSSNLPANSVDLVFICDAYHHFEYPNKTMASIYKAVKPGGRVVLVDFERVPGKSSEWILNHVRAGKDVFKQEIESAGFEFVKEKKGLFKSNYFLVFVKPAKG